MSVAQIDQADAILIPCNNIRQLSELLWEERFEISSVRIIPWVFNLSWLALGLTIDDKDSRLVPDTAKELTTG